MSTANIAAFLTEAGIDLVLRASNEAAARTWRTRVGYAELVGDLGGNVVSISFADNDEQLLVLFGDRALVLSLQEKGHFFSYLEPIAKSAPIGLAAARAKAQAAAQAPAAAKAPGKPKK
jgi:hypothetical protein